MIPLGLDTAELRAFHAALRGPHRLDVRLQLMDLQHRHLTMFSGRLMDGQVVMDADPQAAVSRVLTLSLLDPDRRVTLDSDDPSDTPLYFDRMVRVYYEVSAGRDDRVSVPVFTGPIVKMSRNSDDLAIECHGKESLARGPRLTVRSWREGMWRSTIIRDLMVEMCGETHYDLPLASQMRSKVGRPVVLGKMDDPWALAFRIARGAGWDLYYDGRGVLQCRPLPTWPVFGFTEPDWLMGEPSVDHYTGDIKNTVVVRGATPAGGMYPVEATRFAPRTHPLSPHRLGRLGARRFLVEEMENSAVRTKAEAAAIAQRRLAGLLVDTVQVQFESLVVPHLELNDVGSVATSAWQANFRTRKATIPLIHSGVMSVGYHRRNRTGLTARRTRW